MFLFEAGGDEKKGRELDVEEFCMMIMKGGLCACRGAFPFSADSAPRGWGGGARCLLATSPER